jgi:hypothetical protein
MVEDIAPRSDLVVVVFALVGTFARFFVRFPLLSLGAEINLSWRATHPPPLVYLFPRISNVTNPMDRGHRASLAYSSTKLWSGHDRGE